MDAATAPQTLRPPFRPAHARAFALFCAFAVIALQIELVFAKSINWDEFYGFGQIHQFRRGEAVPLLQVPYIYLYSWVPSLPGNAIDHIVIIRLLNLGFVALTVAAIFDLARRFASRDAAFLAALAYLAGGHVLLHAFALRADMIAAALLMASLWLLLTRRLGLAVLAGAALLAALAFVATIKSVLYAPLFLSVLWWRRDHLPMRLIVALGVGGIVTAFAAALATGVVASVTTLAMQSAARMFDGGLFPQLGYFADQLLTAPFLALMIVAGIVVLVQQRGQRIPLAFMAACLVPLAAVAIYRNAFPYYFAFALPPAALVAAAGAQWLKERYGLAPVAAILALNALALSLTEDRQVMRDQRTVQAGIAQIFPVPVTYIDDADFVGAYPRAVNHFGSGWGLAGYREAGTPAYRNALERNVVPFLFREGPAMENMDPAKSGDLMLLPEDTAALRDNFIPHWGKVFVAGKQIAPGASEIEILVPGTYTVEGSAIRIDGASYPIGAQVQLDRGTRCVDAGQPATLRWGENLPRPAFAWPDGALYTNY